MINFEQALVYKTFAQRHNNVSGLRNIYWTDQNSPGDLLLCKSTFYSIQYDFIIFSDRLWSITITFTTDLCNSKRSPCHTLGGLASKSLNRRLVGLNSIWLMACHPDSIETPSQAGVAYNRLLGTLSTLAQGQNQLHPEYTFQLLQWQMESYYILNKHSISYIGKLYPEWTFQF